MKIDRCYYCKVQQKQLIPLLLTSKKCQQIAFTDPILSVNSLYKVKKFIWTDFKASLLFESKCIFSFHEH